MQLSSFSLDSKLKVICIFFNKLNIHLLKNTLFIKLFLYTPTPVKIILVDIQLNISSLSILHLFTCRVPFFQSTYTATCVKVKNVSSNTIILRCHVCHFMKCKGQKPRGLLSHKYLVTYSPMTKSCLIKKHRV